MKKFKFTIEGESFEVSINEEDKNQAEVIVNGKPYAVEFEREEAPANKPRVIQRQPAAKTVQNTVSKETPSPVRKAGGAKSVKSPLPGNIFKIPVTVGQAVKRGNALIIIESMKMENEILADRDGTVKAIYVQQGQSVLQGDALIELE